MQSIMRKSIHKSSHPSPHHGALSIEAHLNAATKSPSLEPYLPKWFSKHMSSSLSFISWFGSFKVETPILFMSHDSIRELVIWECKQHGVKFMNVLANPKGSVGRWKSEFLEA